MANDTPNSLKGNCVGSNFYSASPDEDFLVSQTSTAINYLTSDVQKTLHSLSRHTFTGRPSPFIANVLLSAQPGSSHNISPDDVLDDKMFGFVKLFIASLAKGCTWDGIKDLTSAKAMISMAMNSATMEAWHSFKSSLVLRLFSKGTCCYHNFYRS